MLRQYDNAHVSFQRALELTPKDTELLGMMGGMYKRLGELQRHHRDVQTAIAVDAEDLYPLLALCGLLVLLQDEPSALSRYRSVLVLTDRTLESGHPDHWTRFARGEAFLAQNDSVGALEELARAMNSARRRATSDRNASSWSCCARRVGEPRSSTAPLPRSNTACHPNSEGSTRAASRTDVRLGSRLELADCYVHHWMSVACIRRLAGPTQSGQRPRSIDKDRSVWQAVRNTTIGSRSGRAPPRSR